MSFRTAFAVLAAGIAGLMASPVSAQSLTYTPTTNLTAVSNDYSLAHINDGKGMVVPAESATGFVATTTTGTITFTFAKCAKVDTFSLWNNVNRTINGVKTYNLKLYGQMGHLLKAINDLTAVQNMPNTVNGNDGPRQDTALGGTAYVHSIQMEITASYNTKVEIREVQISGSESGDNGVCCP